MRRWLWMAKEWLDMRERVGRMRRGRTGETAIDAERGLPRAALAEGWRVLQMAYLRRKYLGRELDHRLRIFDYDVEFGSFDDLRYLLREVFFTQDYLFRSTAAAPYIVDCGSNIGASILYFKRLFPNATVVGFEPSPTTFAILERNVERNALRDVTVHNLALAGRHGELPLYLGSDQGGDPRASLVPGRMQGPTHVVRTVPLSSYLDRPVDFLKMDIEGAELDVVRELERSGTLDRVQQMVIEYHHHVDPTVDTLSTMLAILEHSGFGYTLTGRSEHPPTPGEYQDIAIHAYRKQALPAVPNGADAARTSTV